MDIAHLSRVNRTDILLRYHAAMLAELGPSHWWPGDSPLEIALGAILTQNTNWRNVEKAVANLRQADVLDATRLHAMPEEQLAELLRPAGFFRVKARRLRHFLLFLEREHKLSMDSMAQENMADLRTKLLAISGIGPETADSILLYALGKPSFVVDAYTYRIFSRHGLIPEDITPEELRNFFMDALPHDVSLFNEFHALLVRVGKTWCAKKSGKCASCPLGGFLP